MGFFLLRCSIVQGLVLELALGYWIPIHLFPPLCFPAQLCVDRSSLVLFEASLMLLKRKSL